MPQGDDPPPAPAAGVDGEILGIRGVGAHGVEVRPAIETRGNPRPHEVIAQAVRVPHAARMVLAKVVRGARVDPRACEAGPFKTMGSG